MTPLAKQPDYAAAADELASLHVALAKVEGRRLEIEIELARRIPTEDRESTHVAAALSFVQTGVVTAPDNTPNELQSEHLLMRQQAEALRKVIATRSAQRDRIAGELSAQASRGVAAKHADIFKRYREKLHELDAIVEEEVQLVAGLEKQGYSVSFQRYVQFPTWGRVNEQGSVMFYRAHGA